MLRPYLIHLRPRAWPVVAGHMVVGYALAAGSHWADNWLRGLAAALLWGAALNGGTLAINSAFDEDEGDIGYLDNPPPVPDGLYGFGLLVMLAGQAGSLFISPAFALVYGLCLLMSVAYSTPPLRLKARPGWDLLINATGYGVLTTYAGWAAVTEPAVLPIGVICAGYWLLFAGFYPLTQLYQIEEDRAKGDRTLALMLGARGAVRFALVMVLGAFVLFSWAGAAFGARGLWLAPALAAWLAVLVPWNLRGREYPEQRGMYRALWVWGLTDLIWIGLGVWG